MVMALYDHDSLAASFSGHRHVELEFTNDIDLIMTSVGDHHVMFSQAYPTPDGGYRFDVQHEKPDVREYYVKRNATMQVTTERFAPTVEISSTWHTFIEGVAIVRDSSDTPQATHYLALLVKGEEPGQLVAECPWGRHENRRRDALEDFTDDSIALSRLDLHTMHHQMVDAIAAGDAAAVAAPFHDGAGWVSGAWPDGLEKPLQLHGRAEIEAHYAQFFVDHAMLGVECISRICGEYYVYSELCWRMRGVDGEQAIRIAEYLPVDADGRILARVAYGVPA
jgi:hypothetical protein